MTKQPPTGQAFHPRLEALRGLAALAVAAFHSWYSIWLDSDGRTHQLLAVSASDGELVHLVKWIGRVVANGDGAVIIFFVLSGFVLSGSLVHGPQEMTASARRFFVARLFRIYPAIVFAVLAFAVVFWLTGKTLTPDTAESFSPRGLLQNMLLLDVSIDGVMWSLQLELLAVPLIFAAYFLYRRWGMAALTALCIILMALSFSRGWQQAISGVHQFGLIFAFIPGMMAYFLGEQLLQGCPARIARWLLVITVISFLLTRSVVGQLSNWSVILESLFGAVVVALLAFSNRDKRNLLLDRSVVRFYGRISYSFYLLHPLSLIAIGAIPVLLGQAIASGAPDLGVALMLLVGSTLAVTPLAYAMLRWVERPGIAAGRIVAKPAVVRKSRGLAVEK